MSNTMYRSSLYDAIYVEKGNVGIGTAAPQFGLHVRGGFGAYTSDNKPIFKSTNAGFEIVSNLTFAGRTLGLGIETEEVNSNAVFILNPNIPTSYVHITEPSNGTNVHTLARLINKNQVALPRF